jgi:glycosyltransferase involved in cell wall biosynthesis
MNESPLVSVVIPAYNASKWIAETLESVLRQDFRDFEVIVVDDGSTDDTARVVTGFGERVCFIRKNNGGTGSARNVGIRAARGEYIAFVDADDLWTKEKLRLQVDLLKRMGLAWVYCDAFVFDDASGERMYRFRNLARQYDGDILERLFLGNFIPSPTVVIRKSVFENVGFFSQIHISPTAEDWSMWLHIAAHYPVGLVSVPLADYRVHPASKTTSHNPGSLLKAQLRAINEGTKWEPKRLGPLKNRAMANCYLGAGRSWASMGRLRIARNMFRIAIRLSPRLAEGYISWVGCLIGGWPLRLAVRMRRQVPPK